MKRWVWRVLLVVMAAAALTVGAAAADPVTLDNGVVLEEDSGHWKVTGYTGSGGRLVVSSEYDGKSITSIGASAFKNTNGRRITEVVLPETITLVGDSAFENCVNMKTVIFMPGSTGGVTIGKSAFSGTGVSMLVLPDNLTTIGEAAFANNRFLTKVTIPDSVTSIGSRAFANNNQLKTVYVPAALKPASGAPKPISADAFANTKLESIHYGGDDKNDVLHDIFEARPTGIWRNEVHLATDSTHVNPPTCVDDGLVMGGGFCREASANQTDVCRDLAGEKEGTVITALGHDYQEPLSEFQAEAKKHAPCQAWTWTYDTTCSRCGEELKGLTKEIAATQEHDMAVVAGSEKETPATCKDNGLKTWTEKCKNANCTEEVKKEEVLPKTDKHTYHGFDDFVTLTDAEKAQYFREVPLKDMTCQEDGLIGYRNLCTVCGQLEPCGVCDGDGEIPEDHWTTEAQTHHTEVIKSDPDAYHSQHTDADHAEIVSEKWDVKDCADGGTKTTTYRCKICDKEFEVVENVPAGTHVPSEPETIETPATCKADGHRHKDAVVCTICGTEIEPAVDTVLPKIAHSWGTPVSTEVDENGNPVENKEPTCGEPGVSHVIVVCQNEGCGETEYREIELPVTGQHTWGEWVTENGQQTRTCSVCGKKDSVPLSPSDPDDPDNPDKPDNPDDPDNPSTPEETTYKVDVLQTSNGTTTVSRSTAKAGDLVTVTVSPSSGYVLDMIRVIGGSQLVSLTNLGNRQYRFTMPAANVEVRATYDRTGSDYSGNWTNGFGNSGSGNRSDPRRTTDVMPVQIQEPYVGAAGASERLFQDIPTSHWAAGEINWASQMGYMNGTGNRFNPDGSITQQQMWMVLARLSGEQPANMAEARRWAQLGGYADGSSPTGPVKRHQLVAALYRCARLSGRAGRTTVSLAGYPDSRTVPTVAREAFTWALSTGVISGDAEGRLKPNDTLTRAQFAVILYRYSTRT